MNARPSRIGSRAARGAGAALAMAACTLALAAAQAPSDAASASAPISQAEQLLFTHPHLASVRQPQTLSYAWSAQSAASGAASGRATLALQARADGSCCSAHVDYPATEVAIHLPDFDDATANPVILYFLEAEVRRLQRTTTGQSAHFRRQMRMALATNAQVSDATVRWHGRDVPAHAVRVAPFLDDPYRARFEREAATEYEFLLSDDVPGGVASLTATLPDPAAASVPLERRRLVLEDPSSPTPP
jgi:hypothetical protein